MTNLLPNLIIGDSLPLNYICTACRSLKPLDAFRKSSDRPKGIKNQCKVCTSLQARAIRQKNPAPNRRACRKWQLNNLKKHSEKMKAFYKKHPEKKHYLDILRKTRKLRAVPPWLTPEMKKDIKFIYIIRSQMTNPKNWHIDHIYPLAGKVSSGLHVPWNLRLITKSENLKKYNKFPNELEFSNG